MPSGHLFLLVMGIEARVQVELDFMDEANRKRRAMRASSPPGRLRQCSVVSNAGIKPMLILLAQSIYEGLD